MGVVGKVLGFLFGNPPPIFDENGEVRHNLPKEKWDAWQNRYTRDGEYNWRNHTGMKAKEKKDTRPTT